jgi:hypothetical protein
LISGENLVIGEQGDHGAVVGGEPTLLGEPAADRLGGRRPDEDSIIGLPDPLISRVLRTGASQRGSSCGDGG